MSKFTLHVTLRLVFSAVSVGLGVTLGLATTRLTSMPQIAALIVALAVGLGLLTLGRRALQRWVPSALELWRTWKTSSIDA